MNLNKFISELKRRNVFKVATAYAVAGWLILQVVAVINEPLSMPDWFDTTVIILVAIGFPIALIIAWAFELTPEGLKKTDEVDIDESITPSTGKKLNRIIISVLSLAVIFLLINRVFYAQSTQTTKGTASIAVLPFADMSSTGDQAYFSDGLSEELLNVLAKEPNLKVSGRTSSFRFRGENEDFKKIATALGVDHILEGSVRRSGNKIRITAQLVKASDGFHVWSETYDRDYSAETLFQIQDEISQKVLTELKVKLLGGVVIVANKAIPTKNTEAFEAYLKGNQLLVNRDSDEIEAAIVQFEKAIKLDPNFSLAYARLAIAINHLNYYGNLELEKALTSIRSNADKAILLDNTSAMAFAALSKYYLLSNDFEKEQETIKKAYDLEPNNAEIVMWYGRSIPGSEAKFRLEILTQAYELDPLSNMTIANMVQSYQLNSDYKNAQLFAEKNVSENPDYIFGKIMLLNLLKDQPNGKLDEAFIKNYEMHQQQPDNFTILQALAVTSTELNLNIVAKEVERKLKQYYPENFSTEELELVILLNDGKYDKFQERVNQFTNISENIDKLYWKLIAFGLVKDYNGATKFISNNYPIYESETLSTFPYNRRDITVMISGLYKNAGRTDVSKKLTNLYCDNVKSKFEFGGDIKKENTNTLWDYLYCAALEDDAKLAKDILEEAYFKRKSKGNMDYIVRELNFMFSKEYPEYTEVMARIDKDIDGMRNNAIAFLKAEGKWPEGMK